MSHCHASLLPSRAVLRIGGADARKFLQGLITSDIGKVQGADAVHAGLLSPQGKVLFDFFLVAEGDGFLADVAREKEEELLKRLAFYRLRAAVEISADPSRQSRPVGAASRRNRAAPSSMPIRGCPRSATVRSWRKAQVPPNSVARPRASRTTTPSASASACRKAASDYAFGDAFPHEALFDQLHGVDFNKGCFVGQEVVSRMEHRGTTRKRIVPVEGAAPLPAPGTSIEAAGAPIGTLGSVSGTSGLALIRLDRAEDAVARGETLAAGGVGIALRRPAFARFAVPTTEVPA